VANVAPSVVERGVKAGDLVRAAAPIVGGGGGGRDTLAQAGGKSPEKLDEALDFVRGEIERALA
jgi:alanyl-tRNA synthetase